MIQVKTFNTFWQYMKDQVTGVSKAKTVADESELTKYIKEIADKEVFLIAVIPSSDTDFVNLDNKKEDDNCVVYILKKSNVSDMTDADLLNDRSDTQDMITILKKKLFDMSCDCESQDPNIKLTRTLVPSFHTDPEYNYLGCNGWSISFKWKTNAYNNAF